MILAVLIYALGSPRDSGSARHSFFPMVHKGQIWASNEDLEHLIGALSQTKPLHLKNPDGMPLLTRREEEVVHLVADGLKNREIAERLKVKEHSIRNYLYRIFENLGVSTRVELILYAFSHRDGSS
jgi:DNA-binding NarL/FixJ family response regulator